jgi:hypothetical protein
MSDLFENVNFDDINLDEYNSIDISFSKEQKTVIKKTLRKQLMKRETKIKRNWLVAAAALALITILVVSNGSSALAEVMPAFNKLYTSLGFKQEYLKESTYIGKTYEENGIKITLENLIGTKHIIKVALKVEYSDKVKRSEEPLVFLTSNYEGKTGGSAGGIKNIDENTKLNVMNFMSDEGFPSKGNLKITAQSEKFKETMVWDIKVDFSKNFEGSIYKNVTMTKDIGITIDSIEASKIGTIISTNKDYHSVKGTSYFIKVDNKLYNALGFGWSTDYEKKNYTVEESINNDVIKHAKKISLVAHSVDNSIKNSFDNMTKEEGNKHYEDLGRKINSFPKAETNGVTYTKEITFNNGNKAEIYKVERENGKLRVFVKGDDKKQLFDLVSNLRTNTGDLGKSIEETTDGWIAEFDDITSDKVTIEMVNGVLEWTGDYSVDESELLLK